jgi:hypothetical protein
MSYNIKIEEKKGPNSSPHNDSEYYQYYFKMPNKEGEITEYLIETSTNPYAERTNYSVFERLKEGAKEYMYINPSAQWAVDRLPFTLKEAEKAVETYELRNQLNPDTVKKFGGLIDEL